ncbi:MAG: DedA family protein [Gemmatimonadales bacterium]|nr:DedA family protein [Gemmatimonadales bacterium]
MIESILQSIAGWPPLVVYGLVALSCFVENFFPPAPSDLLVALAGFLSFDGNYDPITIFLTAWAGGMAGTTAVYYLVRKFGDRFVESRIGRILLPPDAMAFLLKEYGRYGMVGLFITRLLPGFRSVVAPFGGLNRLPVRVVLVPVALAHAVWYALITWIGTRIGNEWETVVRVINRLIQTLGVVAILIAAILAVGFVLWRRRRKAA